MKTIIEYINENLNNNIGTDIYSHINKFGLDTSDDESKQYINGIKKAINKWVKKYNITNYSFITTDGYKYILSGLNSKLLDDWKVCDKNTFKSEFEDFYYEDNLIKLYDSGDYEYLMVSCKDDEWLMITDDNGFLVILNDDKYTNKLNLSKIKFDDKKDDDNDIVFNVLNKLGKGWLSNYESKIRKDIKSWVDNYNITKIEDISFVTKKYSSRQELEFNTKYKLIDDKTYNEYKNKLETGKIVAKLDSKGVYGYKITIKDNMIAHFGKFKCDEKEFAIFGIINK